MANHPTRLSKLLPTGDVQIVTEDEAVAHKAMQAQTSGLAVDFVFWAGASEEIIKGKVTSYDSAEPFTFIVRSEMKTASAHAKVAETARQERTQGGQPQTQSSGDPAVNAAGPRDNPKSAPKRPREQGPGL